MMKINNNKPHTVNFGITTRKTDMNLGGEHCVKNCNYIVRQSESSPFDVAEFLSKRAKEAGRTEMKIWGASDLSQFCGQTIALQKTMGLDDYKELFGDIDLMDIDRDIANRSKKHIIGMTSSELEDISYVFDESPFKYFTKLNDGENHFLPGELSEIQVKSVLECEMLESGAFSEFEKRKVFAPKPVEFYKISPDLMYGTKINADEKIIDIREGVKRLPNSKEGIFRYFEFANGWYFLPENDQIKLVDDIAEKMKKGDVMKVGSCEVSRRYIGERFIQKGFETVKGLKELFIKRI